MRFIILLLPLILFAVEPFTERQARIVLAKELIDAEVDMRDREIKVITEDLARIGQALANHPDPARLNESRTKREARRMLIQGQLDEWRRSKAKVDAAWAALCQEVLQPYLPPAERTP